MMCSQNYLIISPLILWASCISQGRIVTHLACIMHKFVSSISQMIYASATSCNANTIPAWIKWYACSFCKISQTSWRNGIFGISSSVIFWYQWISHRACVPSLNLLPFTDLEVAWGLILSNCLIPMQGIFPFPLFFMTAFPLEEGTRGIPIIAHFYIVAFVHAIFCNEKYLK